MGIGFPLISRTDNPPQKVLVSSHIRLSKAISSLQSSRPEDANDIAGGAGTSSAVNVITVPLPKVRERVGAASSCTSTVGGSEMEESVSGGDFGGRDSWAAVAPVIIPATISARREPVRSIFCF